MAQVPRQRPGIGSDHRDARRVYAVSASHICYFSWKSEDVVRGVGIGIGIAFVGWLEKDALARVVANQHSCKSARMQNAGMAARLPNCSAVQSQSDSTAIPASRASGSQRLSANHGVL